MMSENGPGTYFSTSSVIQETGVTLRQLYYWEKIGLLHPQYEKFGLRMYRRYDRKDVELLSRIVSFLKEGYGLQMAGKKALEASSVEGGD